VVPNGSAGRRPNAVCRLPQNLQVGVSYGALMVTIHFVRADGEEVYSAGPTAWVRAADGSLEIGPDGGQIAHYGGGVWNVAGHDVPKWQRKGRPNVIGWRARLGTLGHGVSILMERC
jgi:hypothetical protein